MLNPVVSESSNAVDAGDAPPARPTSRPSVNYDTPSRASRLLSASENSNVSLTSASTSLMRLRSIELWDADDRTFEEKADLTDSSMSAKDARLYRNRILDSTVGASTRDLSPGTAEQRAQDKTPTTTPTTNPRQFKIAIGSISKQCRWTWIIAVLVLIAIAMATYVLAVVDVATANEESTTTPPIAMATTPPIASKTDGSLLIRLEATMAFLARFSGSSLENLDDAKKPENLAASWIATVDTLAYTIPTSEEDADFMSFLQRYAVAVFYFALNGPGWVDQLSFLSGTHICDWNSTLTLGDGEVVTLGITCNSKKEVTTLLMRKYNT